MDKGVDVLPRTTGQEFRQHSYFTLSALRESCHESLASDDNHGGAKTHKVSFPDVGESSQ